MKALRYLLPLAIFAALGVLLFSGLGKDTKKLPSVLIDKPAPAFDLPELRVAGERVSRAALLGKVYVVNVWGSWCAGCRQEHAVLTEFSKRDVVPVVGLNWKDPPADALRWLTQFGDPYDMIASDPEGDTVIDFGVYGAPETFLIDAAGTIRWKFVGPLTTDVVDNELVPRIAALEGAKAP